MLKFIKKAVGLVLEVAGIRVPGATAGQVLVADADGTFTPGAGGGGGSLPAGNAAGVLWYNSTAPAWQSNAAPAADGKFLRSNGTAAPTWDTVTILSLSDENTWTAEQTFRYVRFTRAVRSMALDVSGTTHTLAFANEPAIRLTNTAARTLTLFDAAPEDAGLEWRIHDAARTADTANVTIQAPAAVTLNGVTAGSVTLNTKGGAVIVRVTGESAWETVGL